MSLSPNTAKRAPSFDARPRLPGADVTRDAGRRRRSMRDRIGVTHRRRGMVLPRVESLQTSTEGELE